MDFSDLLKEIEICLKEKHYIAALMMALTIPDSCGKMEYPKEKNTSRYKKWYSNFVDNVNYINEHILQPDEPKNPWLSADLVYSIRCNMLHENESKIDDKDIHQEENKNVDFKLIFNESSCCERSVSNDGTEKNFYVNSPYLTKLLLYAGKLYYKDNIDKFKEYKHSRFVYFSNNQGVSYE